jgi:hypothetical protein
VKRIRATTVTMIVSVAIAFPAFAQQAYRPYAAARYERRPVYPPRVTRDPNWIPDYNIVPRYRYDPRDDRVDTGPTAKPVVPSLDDYGGTGGSGW